MEIRRVTKSDLPEISEICKICFGKTINEKHYNWLYDVKGTYFSSVMVEKSMIIAHCGIIVRDYTLRGQDLKVGLVAGVMMLPDYQMAGDFYYILKECLSMFKGDIVIGFPNKNAHGILRKLFKFNCIPDNLYQLELKNEIKYLEKPVADPLTRNNIKWRINRHPAFQYNSLRKGDCHIIYKEYLGNSVDILYSNIINNDFVDIIRKFSKVYEYVNIISIYETQLEQIGFKKVLGNEFVYKAYNTEYENFIFPCQMIDSDIY